MCLPVKPYKLEREWKHAGLQCAVVQIDPHGYRCGYVRIPPGHPTRGKNYEYLDVNVHGGLSFGVLESCEHADGRGYWVGFDCAHLFDAMEDPIYSSTIYPWRHYWTQSEVEFETERLAEQLAAMSRISFMARSVCRSISQAFRLIVRALP
jgi:hypothetical protein